jgi:spore maturation protein CgeB
MGGRRQHVVHEARRCKRCTDGTVTWNSVCYGPHMNFGLFYHSLVSDWNHGNAHFLRGVAAELVARGHRVRVLEPRNGWSRAHLIEQHGPEAIADFHAAFPQLTSELYDPQTLDLDNALDDVDIVIVHEWTALDVLEKIANHRTRQGNYGLLFHDTHHRAVSAPDALAEMRIERFDGVLAFGESLVSQYRRLGWGRRVWAWHEAADTRTFYPRTPRAAPDADLIWVGNWGDDERVRELDEYLLGPVRELHLSADVFGVRYPEDALTRLGSAGIRYRGWIANHRVPEAFARSKVTVHVPRGPYTSLLPGIPTIRPFEALACGIPLVSAPWDDVEGLFRRDDFIMVHDRAEMAHALRRVLNDVDFAAELSRRGLETIRTRHTCAHRVDELLRIISDARLGPASAEAAETADSGSHMHQEV